MKLNIQLFADGKVVIQTELDTKSFEVQIDNLEDKLDTLQKEYQIALRDVDFPEEQLRNYREEIEKTTNKIKDLKIKQAQLNKTDLSGISSSLSNIIGKVTKWGLAVFGVRSAYMFIRQAMNELAQTDDGMSAKLQYIRWALANTIKPIIEWIINAVYEIVGAIGGFIKFITGKNIFSKSTVKDFSDSLKKANKNSKGLSKNIKEIQKTLAGFDEINKLGGGGTGVGLLGGGTDDISKYIEAGNDLVEQTEKWSKKIKRWFLGGDTFEEGLQNGIEKIKIASYPLVNWFITKIWQPIKQGYIDYLKPLVEWTKNKIFKPMWNDIKTTFTPTYQWLNDKVFTPIKDGITTIKNHFFGESQDTKTTILNDWTETKNGILRDFTPFVNKIIYYINKMLAPFGIQLDYIQDEAEKTGDTLENAIGGATDTIQQKIAELTGTPYEVKVTSNDLTNLGKSVSGIVQDFKTLTGKTWSVKSTLSLNLKNIGDTGMDALRDAFSKIGIKLPKMAKGGIVNMPGRGVPVGAMAGERGMEGVIPLTDSQQMALLGEAIGRYITVNANIPINMNGRLIARETKKIQNESSFATNGGAF